MVYKLPKEAIADNELEASQLSSNLVNWFVPIGGIIMWSGTVAEAEALTNWRICDGQNGTPDLRDKFVLGVGSSVAASTANKGDTNNNNSITLTEGQMPSHNHNITDNGHSHTINNHTHPSGTLAGSNTHNHNFKGVGGNDHNDSERNAVVMRNDSNTMYTSHSGSGVQNATITISGNTGGTSANSNHRHSFSGTTGGEAPNTNNDGGGQSHENRPPYYALCYIMKT